jgi:hypothetical protein
MSSVIPDDLRLSLVRRAGALPGLGAYVFGAATGMPYFRFLGLRSAAERALWRGDLDEAEAHALELLRIAERFQEDWHYGNAVHHGHSLLGRVALGRNNLTQAIEHLHESGKTPGSPQLKSFGPNMLLAKALLELGETDAVLKYFDLCRDFWRAGAWTAATGRHPLDGWEEDVRADRTPEFGPNLVY